MRLRRGLLWSLLIVVAVSACDVGGGTSTELQPGPPTSAPPGDTVLYVAFAEGDAVAAYRLGTDGLLPEQPFDVIFLDNPRRLTIAGDVLYVSIRDSVVSIPLATDGSLPDLPGGRTQPRGFYDPYDTIVANGKIYVAAAGPSRIDVFDLDANGNVGLDPSSTGDSLAFFEYNALAMADGYLYAGAIDGAQIDTYAINADGSIGADPEQQEPDTRVFFPEAITVRDGVLYTTDEDEGALFAFVIESNGLLPPDPTTQTLRAREFYRDLLIVDDRAYAAAFHRGRIDTYRIGTVDGVPDMFPEEAALSMTESDAATYPRGLVTKDGVLYVALAGRARVDAYILDAGGIPARFPSSSTTARPEFDLPIDLALYELP